MRQFLKSLSVVTRPEFIPANTGSLFVGLAWALESGFSLNPNFFSLLLLTFVVISSVGTIGAHLNTYSDIELDLTEPRKQKLSQAVKALGKSRFKKVILIELLISTLLIIYFSFLLNSYLYLVLWGLAVFLAYTYSMEPTRFKRRSILAMVSLCLVLSILPVYFVYRTFNNTLSGPFLFFLIGHTLTIYAVIIPTEIRDYFSDKQMNVETMTVWLGLKKATLFAMSLLIIGGLLTSFAYFSTIEFSQKPIFRLSLLATIIGVSYVLIKYNQLYKLTINFEKTKNPKVKEQIVEIAANNPKWITGVTQSTAFVSIVLIIAKLLA